MDCNASASKQTFEWANLQHKLGRSMYIMHWDQCVSWFQRCQIFQMNKATLCWCNYHWCNNHCSNYHSARQTLFEKVKRIDSSILKQSDWVITKILLFGDEKLKAALNKSIMLSTIEFLQATKRFKTSLFN